MIRAKAITKFVRISSLKARPTADVIRGLPVEEARTQLLFSCNKAGRALFKTLNSAVANAESLFNVSKENLRVAEVFVNEGPQMKRSKSRSRGKQHPVIKRTSHFTVVVEAE
jgi:large subunit ribosomal protein L22